MVYREFLQSSIREALGVPWGVSGDGAVWELDTGTYTCFYLNLSPIANFFSYRFGFARRKQFSPCKRQEKRQEQEPKKASLIWDFSFDLCL